MSKFDYDMRVKQGCDLTLVFTTNGDLTGCDAEMMVRPITSLTADPVLSLSSGGGDIVLGTGPESTIEVTLQDVDTQDVAAGMYVYDLILIDSLGKRMDMLQGSFEIAFEVTQS